MGRGVADRTHPRSFPCTTWVCACFCKRSCKTPRSSPVWPASCCWLYSESARESRSTAACSRCVHSRLFTAALLTSAQTMTQMLIDLGINTRSVYESEFEVGFLKQSALFYRAESQAFIAVNTMSDYMRKVEARMKEEQERVQVYLDGQTEPKARGCAAWRGERGPKTDTLIPDSRDFGPRAHFRAPGLHGGVGAGAHAAGRCTARSCAHVSPVVARARRPGRHAHRRGWLPRDCRARAGDCRHGREEDQGHVQRVCAGAAAPQGTWAEGGALGCTAQRWRPESLGHLRE